MWKGFILKKGKKINRTKNLILDFIFIVIGSSLYALGVNCFSAPNNIAPGGVSGTAILLNFIFGTPIGTMVLLINIPIILWCIIEIGYKLVIKSVVAILISSVLIDLAAIVVPAYKGDLLLVSLFAGVLEGAGLALVFIRGATTGGTDLIARVLNKRVKFLSLGKLMLCVDALVILASGIIYQSLESLMYASIVVFVATNVIDAILYGADVGRGKMFMIMSSKEKEIADKILNELDRGATYLKARGAYTDKEGEILLCAVNRYEISKMHEIIRSVDKNAFVIVGDAGEIAGEGFKSFKPEDKTLKEILKSFENKKIKND